MKTIFMYDLKKKNHGSTKMRGFDIASKLNIKIKSIDNKNIVDNKIIFLKLTDYNDILDFAYNNEIIIDMVDFKNIKQLYLFKRFDYGIFTSYSQLDKFSKYFKYPDKCVVIYHHWDESLRYFENIDIEKLNIGYFGSKEKCHLYNSIDEIDFINVDEKNFNTMKHLYKNYNAHYIIKPENQDELIQPMLKLSNASVLNCPVICINNKQYIELLTEEYPYYCSSYDKKDVLNTIDFIKKTYKKEEWFKSLKILENIKKETSMDNVIKKYKNMIL